MQDTSKTNKLLEAENKLKELRASAMSGASDETVDATAAELGMTRRELVSYVIKRIRETEEYRRHILTVNCLLRSHAVLQRVVSEFEKVGFQAEYHVDIVDDVFASIAFAVYMVSDAESARFCKLYKANAFTALPPSIQVCPCDTEFDLYYKHLAGRDEKPMRDALSDLDAWAKSLREKDRDGLNAMSKLYWTP